ncbi:MAG: hypothetical protein HQK51_05000 [Oligoflexia bacterium]|nr:hypothetical protein [Oligoflexia bacterium]
MRHDFKGNLRKAQIIYSLIEEQRKSGINIEKKHIEELNKVLDELKNNWGKLEKKIYEHNVLNSSSI